MVQTTRRFLPKPILQSPNPKNRVQTKVPQPNPAIPNPQNHVQTTLQTAHCKLQTQNNLPFCHALIAYCYPLWGIYSKQELNYFLNYISNPQIQRFNVILLSREIKFIA